MYVTVSISVVFQLTEDKPKIRPSPVKPGYSSLIPGYDDDDCSNAFYSSRPQSQLVPCQLAQMY